MGNEYSVVFEYIDPKSDYRGCRFIINYADKTAFDSRETSEENGIIKVIAQGISEAEAQKLYNEVPLECLMRSCVGDATYGENFSFELYKMKVEFMRQIFMRRFIESQKLFHNPRMRVTEDEILALRQKNDNGRGLVLMAIEKSTDPDTGEFNDVAYNRNINTCIKSFFGCSEEEF